MEEQKLFGKLFNTIPLYDENQLDVILNTMDKKTANYMLVQAVKYAYHQGVYSLGETEIISKSIRISSKAELEEN